MIRSIEEFIAATSTGEVIVKFTAPWCAPCKSMSPILHQISQEKKIRIVEVNVDEASVLCAALNIQGVPFLAHYKDGKPSLGIQGSATKQHIVEKFGL